MIPNYWKYFIEENDLAGKDFTIPESVDLSELDGGSLKIFNESEILNEANDFYPGLAVKQFGFIPVAGCLYGSGDPYFININDRKNGPLYRVYHDAEMDEEDIYDMEEAINIVLNNYTELLKYADK